MMNKYLSLNRIEFLVTNRCTSKCRHCHVLPGIRTGTLTIADAKLAIDLACQDYSIKSVLVFGGEPLLYPEMTCSIFEYATAKGIPAKSIITNCFWTRNHSRIDEICQRLRNSSVTDVMLSVDYFHQEWLDFEIVQYAIQKLSDLQFENICLHPCWYESPTADNDYDVITRDYISKLSAYGIPTSNGNTLFASGNAALNYREKFRPLQSIHEIFCGNEPYTGRPDRVDTLSIEPDATISICGQESMAITDFMTNYDPHKNHIMNTFLNGGINGLLEIAEGKGINFRADSYYSPCEACAALRKEISGEILA